MAETRIAQALLARAEAIDQQLKAIELTEGAKVVAEARERSKAAGYNDVGSLKIAANYVPFPPMLGGEDATDKVISFIVDAWITAAVHLGEDDARELFERLAGRNRGKRGPARGAAESGRDFELWRAYEKFVRKRPNERRTACHQVAEMMHAHHPHKYGATVQAVKKRIQRLRRARDKK